MKILLINNHTVHLESLGKSLAGHDVEVQKYQPGLDFHHQDKDIIILSGGGGEGLEIHDEHQPGQLWYDDQMDFIRSSNKPIIGICMGFEVIAQAYGAPVTKASSLVSGTTKLQVSKMAESILSRRHLVQFEAHRWRVEDVPADFEVLATSKTGVEMFRRKNILATQFHPEKGGTINLQGLIEQLV